jgi:hypothetical protein
MPTGKTIYSHANPPIWPERLAMAGVGRQGTKLFFMFIFSLAFFAALREAILCNRKLSLNHMTS